MDILRLRDKIAKQKAVIISFLFVSVILIALGAMPIGYSVKDNAHISIDFAKMNESYNKILNTRLYLESYDLAVVDDIQIDSLAISYKANDPSFKGILTVSISENNEILKSISTEIEATGLDEENNEEFAIANIDFEVGTQLLKGGVITPY